MSRRGFLITVFWVGTWGARIAPATLNSLKGPKGPERLVYKLLYERSSYQYS